MQIQEEGSRKRSKDDSLQRRFMKDDGDAAHKQDTVLLAIRALLVTHDISLCN